MNVVYNNLFQHLCGKLDKHTAFTIVYYNVITDSYHEADIHCFEPIDLIKHFEKTYHCKIGKDVGIINIKPKKFCMGCYYNEPAQRYHACLGY